MNKKSDNRYPGLGLLMARFILGGVFIYAGILKVGSPQVFADSLAAYQILPTALINLTALGLPFFEVACGLMVLTGFHLRTGSLGLLLLSILFIAAIVHAMMHGLSIDCGCFGAHSWLDSSPWAILGRDGVLLGIALFIYDQSLRDQRHPSTNEI